MEGSIDSYSESIMCWQFDPAPHLNNKVKVGILQIRIVVSLLTHYLLKF